MFPPYMRAQKMLVTYDSVDEATPSILRTVADKAVGLNGFVMKS